MSKETVLSIPGEVSKLQSMANGAVRIQFDSQESIPAALKAKLFESMEKQAYMAILPELRPIEPEEVVDLPPLKKVEGKTPSQRLHSVLFVYWKQLGEQGDFDLFYADYMNRIIEKIKEKLS
jgi:hypothetical protein